jgi:arylsulfatase A-like enzyme
MANQPNLLFIFTDQQRADTLGCYGNPLVQTPNLDRLAQEGVLFENAYVTQPVCTPSRSSIMTGLYPHSTGLVNNNVSLPPEVQTIAEMVSPDYVKGYYGKWHLGDEVVPQHGFEEWLSIEDYYRKHYSKEEYLDVLSDYHHYLVNNGFEPDRERYGAQVFDRVTVARLPEQHTKARFVGREAARFVRQQTDRPFILYVNMLEPHRPFYGPFDDMYAPEDIPVGPHFRRRPPSNSARVVQMMAEHYMRAGHIDGQDLTTEAGCRKTRAKYLGNVTLVDHAVGDILQALEESEHADNTIVVFTSEHGDMMGDHGFFEKCVMYEEAIKVPLIVRLPGAPHAGRSVGGRLSQIDLVPTLLDLLGQPVPEHLEGLSRARVLSDGATLAETGGADAFVEWSGNEWRPPRKFEGGIPPEKWLEMRDIWRTVITAEGWKLNLSPTDQSELYNLNNDPYEQVNLFGDAGQRARVQDLTGRIRSWQERTNDQATLSEP